MMSTQPPTSSDPLVQLRFELEQKYFSNLGPFGRGAIQNKLDLLWTLSLNRGGDNHDAIREEYSTLVPLVAQ